MKSHALLKALSALMMPVALYPLYAVLSQTFGLPTSPFHGPGFFALFAMGYLLSFGVIREYNTKHLREILAVCCYILILPITVVVCLVAWQYGLWVAVFHALWTALLLSLAIHYGSRHYYDSLVFSFNAMLGGALFVAATLDYVFETGFQNILLYSICIFAFIIVLLYNQSGLDSRVLVHNRVSSAIPSRLRQTNVFMIALCFAAIFLLLLIKDFVVPVLKAIAALVGALLLKILTLLFKLLSPGQEIAEDIEEPALPPAGASEMEALGEGSPFWTVIGFLLLAVLLFVTIRFFVKKLLPAIKPALRRFLRRIKALLLRLLALLSGGRHAAAKIKETAFSDSVETLTREPRHRKRGKVKYSDLRRIHDTTMRIRFLYRLMLHRLKVETRPSDTAGDILGKMERSDSSLHDFTRLYEAVRYGEQSPDESMMKDAKGLFDEIVKG